ncbi:substrate-binding periplasmic protein [Colwellia sp. MEBiC06753]
MNRCLFLSLVLLFVCSLTQAKPITVRVVTEDAYPLQYMEDGQLVGPAFKLVEQVLTEANIDYYVEVVPWARAYSIAETQPNTLIFSIARTPARESLFNWIGTLMTLEYYYYGLAEKFKEKQYVEADFKDMRIGTVNKSATYQYLKNQQHPKLYPVASAKQNFEKLLSHRIDVFPGNITSFKVSCTQFNVDCSLIKRLAPLGLPPTQLYFAMSKSTSNEVVERIKQAYQAINNKDVVDDALKPMLAWVER